MREAGENRPRAVHAQRGMLLSVGARVMAAHQFAAAVCIANASVTHRWEHCPLEHLDLPRRIASASAFGSLPRQLLQNRPGGAVLLHRRTATVLPAGSSEAARA